VFWLLWWTDALLLAFALLVAVSIGSTLRQWTVLEKRRGEADSGAASPSRP
jgi:hypothetical protein